MIVPRAMFHLNRDIYGVIETTSSCFCAEPNWDTRVTAVLEMTMSTLTSRSAEPLDGGLLAGALRWIAAWPLRLMSHWHRHATIKALRELDDATLRDVGLTRADIDEAARDKSS